MLRRVLPLLLLIAACSGDDDPTAAPTTTSTTSTTAPAAGVTATVDWTARTVTIEGTSYGVAFCEGDAPLLCITSPDEEHLGVIEHAEFDPVPDLDGFSADFAASMRDDRVSYCDPDFELDPDETTPTMLFGQAGVRYGYTGTIGSSVVERVVAHASIVEDRLHLVTVSFLADEGGCLSREAELPIDSIEDVEPILDAVVAGSTR